MTDTLPIILFFFIGLGLGNSLGDNATLKACATKSEARMVGGGVIECSVKKGQQ